MTTIISSKLDQSLSDMMRLATKKDGGEEISAKIAAGRESMSKLGTTITTLRAALNRLKTPVIDRNFTVASGKVAARSLELNLTYSSDPLEDDPAKKLAEVSRFSSVAAGTLRINGVAVAIDPAADSLDDVVARINAANAGATARIDRSGDRLEILSARARTPLIVEEGATGFFTAADIAPRVYQPRRSAADALSDGGEVMAQLKEMSEALNELFLGKFPELDETLLTELRDGLKAAITTVVKAHGGSITSRPMRSGFGVDFDFSFFSKSILKVTPEKFMNKAETDLEGLYSFLAGDTTSTKPGLAPSLLETFAATLNDTVTSIGNNFAAGMLTDLKA